MVSTQNEIREMKEQLEQMTNRGNLQGKIPFKLKLMFN